ncbi:MAG: transglycosylase SLT domain-containing protein [Pseudomonadota bacterium]|nr:transglycosylase SLT domain-containing protein [Pseudomonadota bacterium]
MRKLLLLAGLAATPACAEPVLEKTLPVSALPTASAPVLTPFAECDAAIGAANPQLTTVGKRGRAVVKSAGLVPDKILPSIARVESGRLDASTGKIRPWPWTINVDGVGYFFDSKPQVIAAVQALQAKGKRSIDVGCMQVNLMHHPKAFADLDEAFDPATNARYAVKFLVALYQQTRDWPLATAWYHSSTPEFGEQYQRLVFGRVVTPMGAGPGKTAAAAANGIWPSSSIRYAAMPPASFNFGAFAPARPAPAMFGGIQMLGIGSQLPVTNRVGPKRR